MEDNTFKKTASLMLLQCESILQGWYPEGRTKGKRFWIGDPENGSGNSCNVDLETGLWYDFASGDKGGDLVSLYAHKERMSMGQALRELKEIYGPHDPVIAKPPKHVALRGPGDLINGMDKVWTYRDADGDVLCYVCRKDRADGKKIFRPVSYDERQGQWVARGYKTPKPLYNLDMLSKNPETKVLVVEGEKCADAAQGVLGSRAICTTWMGGASSVNKTDWSPLSGRDVTLWPDADKDGTGQAAMLKVAGLLKDTGGTVKLVDVSDAPADKWDIADAVNSGWGLQEIQEWVRTRVSEFTGRDLKIAQKAQNIQNNIVSIAPDNTALADAGGLVALWSSLGLQLVGQANKPAANVYNVSKIMEAKAHGIPDVWYDTFENAIVIRVENQEVRKVIDGDITLILRQLQGYYGMSDLRRAVVIEYFDTLEVCRTGNWAKEWIEGLKWDGTYRLKRFFIDVCGAEESVYHEAASENFWVSLAARIASPGCQVDTMPILEGEQGVGKSRLLRIIGGRFHAEIEGTFDEKEVVRSMSGKALIEFGELHALKKADVAQLKAFLTRTVDTTRALYSRFHKDIPRHCVFVGTTNQDEYLVDETGNRRFWPIRIGTIRDQEAAEFREQYYAEAYAKYKSGHMWWLMPEGETLEAQVTRVKDDAFTDTVAKCVMGLGSTFRMSELLEKLDVPSERWDFILQRRTAVSLKVLGYRNVVIKSPETKRAARYWTKLNGAGQMLLDVEF